MHTLASRTKLLLTAASEDLRGRQQSGLEEEVREALARGHAAVGEVDLLLIKSPQTDS